MEYLEHAEIEEQADPEPQSENDADDGETFE
jgi:hypothetical protein